MPVTGVAERQDIHRPASRFTGHDQDIQVAVTVAVGGADVGSKSRGAAANYGCRGLAREADLTLIDDSVLTSGEKAICLAFVSVDVVPVVAFFS